MVVTSLSKISYELFYCHEHSDISKWTRVRNNMPCVILPNLYGRWHRVKTWSGVLNWHIAKIIWEVTKCEKVEWCIELNRLKMKFLFEFWCAITTCKKVKWKNNQWFQSAKYMCTLLKLDVEMLIPIKRI